MAAKNLRLEYSIFINYRMGTNEIIPQPKILNTPETTRKEILWIEMPKKRTNFGWGTKRFLNSISLFKQGTWVILGIIGI